MKDLHQNTLASVEKIVQTHFLYFFEKEIDQYISFLVDFEKMLKSYDNTLRKQQPLEGKDKDILWTNKTLAIKNELFAHLAGLKRNYEVEDFDEKFAVFFRKMGLFISSLDEKVKCRQKAERFQLNINDKFPARGLKIAKIAVFRLGNIPNSISNLFRKTKKRKTYWKHDIPLQNLAEIHLKEELALALLQLYRNYFKLLTKSLGDLEKFSNSAENIKDALEETTETTVKLDILEYQKTIAISQEKLLSIKGSLKENAAKIVKKQFAVYKAKIAKVGTVELLGMWYHGFFLRGQKKNIRKKFKNIELPWIQSMDILFNTWLFHLEFKVLNYVAMASYLEIEKNYCIRINDYIIKELDSVKNFILDTIAEVVNIKNENSSDVILQLQKERRNVHARLSNDIIPKTVDFIVGQDLPNLVNQIEISVDKQVKRLSTTRTISKKTKPELPVSQIIRETVHPIDLVNHEAHPSFKKAIGEARNTIFQELSKIQEHIKEVTNIVDFALDSAIEAASRPDEDPPAHQVAEQGLRRALLKVEEVNKSLDILFNPVTVKLREEIKQFSHRVISLLNVDELYKLRSRIAASKAIDRPLQLKKRLQNWITIGIPALGTFLATKAKELKKWYFEMRIQLGIDETPEVKSTEITNYFAESKAAVGRLPYVYQRLFSLGPVFDDNLIIERTEENEMMDAAWKSWCKCNFSPVALIGERGSGISTMINCFLNRNCQGYKVNSIKLEKMTVGVDAFVEFLISKLGYPNVKSFDELVAMLKNNEYRQIIVLENIQLLFIKKVAGFGALKLLFELISKTSTQVLWLTTCTLYAWEYLQKTVNISDYHAYIIRLGDLSNEAIVEAISCRHRISGYEVEYVATKKYETNRFKRQSHSEQQTALRKEYFNRLTSFAQSNLSIAIVYWLRSAKKVEGNTIYIGLQDVEYSFIYKISPQKIFALYEIIVHGSLTAIQLAAIRNYPVHRADLELMALRDDGFLFCSDKGAYELNLLLYRPIVRLLKSKNRIH